MVIGSPLGLVLPLIRHQRCGWRIEVLDTPVGQSPSLTYKAKPKRKLNRPIWPLPLFWRMVDDSPAGLVAIRAYFTTVSDTPCLPKQSTFWRYSRRVQDWESSTRSQEQGLEKFSWKSGSWIFHFGIVIKHRNSGDLDNHLTGVSESETVVQYSTCYRLSGPPEFLCIWPKILDKIHEYFESCLLFGSSYY